MLSDLQDFINFHYQLWRWLPNNFDRFLNSSFQIFRYIVIVHALLYIDCTVWKDYVVRVWLQTIYLRVVVINVQGCRFLKQVFC